MFFDPMYLLFMLPGLALAMWAQAKTKSAYAKYSLVQNMQGLPGWRVARIILDANGLQNVQIERIPGELTDHYDPRTKVLGLSEGVAEVSSVAAMGIAAHEVGHALQDAGGYAPLRARAGLVPLAQIGSQFGVIAIMGGMFLNMFGLAVIGLVLFSFGALFSLVTLPVEFDASRRALVSLRSSGLVSQDEYSGAKAVLSAAAWTYVAGFVSALLTVLYFALSLFGGRRDR